MSDLARLTLHFQIFHGGVVIKLNELGICPEKITLRPSGDGLRLDVAQYGGDHLAWFLLPTAELLIEITP